MPWCRTRRHQRGQAAGHQRSPRTFGDSGVLHEAERIARGACAEVCPPDAIQSIDELSPEWETYATAAKELFERVGSPGGAAYACEPIDDHDVYARSSTED